MRLSGVSCFDSQVLVARAGVFQSFSSQSMIRANLEEREPSTY